MAVNKIDIAVARAETRTRVGGFKVHSDDHYTTRALVPQAWGASNLEEHSRVSAAPIKPPLARARKPFHAITCAAAAGELQRERQGSHTRVRWAHGWQGPETQCAHSSRDA